MFVLKSRFNRLLVKYDWVMAELTKAHNKGNAYARKYRTSLLEHRETVIKYRELLAAARIGSITESPFSQTEIKSLIRLCHPDRHGNKTVAVQMTQKLLSLKE